MSKRISFRTNDGWGWFSYAEDNVLIIGESWSREGGTLYCGEYKGDETPYILSIKKDDLEQYNRIVKYFSEYPSDTEEDIASETTKMELKCKYFLSLEYLVKFVNETKIKKEDIQNILTTIDGFHLVYWTNK